MRPDAGRHFVAVHVRHHHVEQHQIDRRLLVEQTQTLGAIGRGQHVEAGEFQVRGDDLAQVLVVVDHEHASRRLLELLHARTGSERLKVLPRPGSLRTSMVPPCARASALAMNSPRPLPSEADASARSTR